MQGETVKYTKNILPFLIWKSQHATRNTRSAVHNLTRFVLRSKMTYHPEGRACTHIWRVF